MASIQINRTFEGRIVDTQPTTAFTDTRVGASTSVSRGIVKLPFTGITAGSTITAATLDLYLTATSNASNNRVMSVYRCKRVMTSSATWNTYNGSDAWATAGAANTTSDREATASGTKQFNTTDTINQYYSIDLTAAHVQAMFDGTYTNNGFILQMATETADQYDFISGTYVARWTITYTPPAGASFLLNFL